ncbi:MAG: hypothetical protein ACP5DC_02315 [Halothiobacillaceae bacterium]
MKTPNNLYRAAPLSLALAIALTGCGGGSDNASVEPAPQPEPEEPIRSALKGSYYDRVLFDNPAAHIPPQCYIETANGHQNACLFCHTNGLYERGKYGNNNPQAGKYDVVGDLQTEYAFASNLHPLYQNNSFNTWENVLRPETLRAAVAAMGIDPATWDMTAYIRQDNWQEAFDRRPGTPDDWDPGVRDDPMRLLPGLSSGDLPADGDGFVRSANPENGLFEDQGAWNTGWRAVNFMPYGIFTPHAGSVSGIYIRLPEKFMKDAQGQFSRAVYEANLDLLARVIQDRLTPDSPGQYHGAAGDVTVEPGLYPLGTEFAHPLHYVDLEADGSADAPSRYPGTRSDRVKEVRYMYKLQPFDPNAIMPGNKSETAPVYANANEGWIENGAGWILAGYIEDANGALRPQNAEELTQCAGCHSGNAPQPERQYELFTAGTGNTVDSTFAFPRQLPGARGWAEMDYLGYVADGDDSASGTPGRSTVAEPANRVTNRGEFRLFLEYVVGASLYGDMPKSMERFMAATIRSAEGYSADWPELDTSSADALAASQKQRLLLMREMTARGDYLAEDGTVEGALLYPPREEALAAAARYRQVVVTQRYQFGKDVFADTLPNFRYYRTEQTAFDHQDGRPYGYGELIVDRPIDTNPTSFTFGVGIGETLIDPEMSWEEGGTYWNEYVPFIR